MPDCFVVPARAILCPPLLNSVSSVTITGTSSSLSLANTLKSLREDIQAEDTLIASRVTWYVTSQAFLLTAYASSWNAGFGWPDFFHRVLPLAALLLSALILASIYAATWAQDVYIREQSILLARIKAELVLEPTEQLAFDIYERTTISNRTSSSGHKVGGRIHALVRLTPFVLPLGFSALWVYAYLYSPLALR
jgi:hypothetical protein